MNNLMMVVNILVISLMGKNKVMVNYFILIEQNMLVNLRKGILMELGVIKERVIIMKEIGSKGKCMEKGKVNGIIKIHNLLESILESITMGLNKDMASILILKELYIELCGSMER